MDTMGTVFQRICDGLLTDEITLRELGGRFSLYHLDHIEVLPLSTPLATGLSAEDTAQIALNMLECVLKKNPQLHQMTIKKLMYMDLGDLEDNVRPESISESGSDG